MSELKKSFDNMKQYLDLPERAVVALEKIARSLDGLSEDDNNEKRGEGNHTEGAPSEGLNDQGNAKLEPDGSKRCPSPADRYGGEFVGPDGAFQAVCSIACKYNLVCKIPHRTFDDLGAPRSQNQKPIEGSGQEGPEAKDLVE